MFLLDLYFAVIILLSMEETILRARKVSELLALYYDSNHNGRPDTGEFLSFDVPGDMEDINEAFGNPNLQHASVTIYNPTKPIHRDGKKFLMGRVEPVETEDSRIMFFEESGSVWRIVDEAPVLGLQDPFHISDVQGWYVIGGVKTFEKPNDVKKITYKTVFYRYKKDLNELFDEQRKVVSPFAAGPDGMKDIRLIDLKNGKIAVFTRPQGGHAGPGKIGYIEIDNLEQLEKAIPRARIIENQFHEDEWGGANELHLLKDGKIGVLGHIAHFDEACIRHYYAMAFVFTPETRKASHLEILTTADEFPPVKPKTGELGGIIFSGGLHRNPDGTADLYVGVGDVRAGKIKIKDPFLKYED